MDFQSGVDLVVQEDDELLYGIDLTKMCIEFKNDEYCATHNSPWSANKAFCEANRSEPN